MVDVARPALKKSNPRFGPTQAREILPSTTGVPSPSPSNVGRIATVMRLQRVVGNQATALIIQRWRDYNGKFIMGAKPPATDPEYTGWIEYEDEKKSIVWGPPGYKTLAELRSAMSKAKAPPPPKPAKDYSAIFLVDPAEIRYSQDSISYTFQDGGNIESTASQLKLGTLTADKVTPIFILERKGKKITLDNRRLWAFKKAGVQIRCQWATPEKIKKDDFKFTAGANGKATITVLGAPSSFKG